MNRREALQAGLGLAVGACLPVATQASTRRPIWIGFTNADGSVSWVRGFETSGGFRNIGDSRPVPVSELFPPDHTKAQQLEVMSAQLRAERYMTGRIHPDVIRRAEGMI